MTTDQTEDNNEQAFVTAIVDSLLRAAAEADGTGWKIIPSSARDLVANDAEPVRIKLGFDGNLRGECVLEFRRSEAAALASELLAEPGETFGPAHSEAFMGLVNRATEEFRSAAAQDYGTFAIESAMAPEPGIELKDIVEFLAANDNGGSMAIRACLDQTMKDALFLHSKARSATKDGRKAITENADKATSEQVNLDLVMDVELNVTLRFGQRQLTLREVLELTSGSVVELDRQVEEPVELILDGIVIARGEAVVIDGNYGLRVSEVSHPVSTPMMRLTT
jgi:flagellar motor switch protein FliN/FliY